MARVATAPKHATAGPSTIGPGTVLDYQREGIVNLARRFGQVLMSAVSAVTPQEGLRNEFGLLVAISHMSGLEQKTLAAAMALDVTTVGQLVDVLEKKGRVRRVSSSTDRRVKLIEITDAGRRHVAEHRPKVIKAQAEVLAVLSEQERRTLTELIARVIAANPQHDRPGAGRRSPKSKTE
jgi:DNA-binding MarR family transcriptional regulator